MGDTRDNTKKVEDIGNIIEGCWKYPKLMIFFVSFLLYSWCIDTFLMIFWCSNSSPFFSLDQIHTILSTMVDDKGRWDSHWEVCHHAVGDNNFLTQKKKIFHPITPKLDIPLWFVMSSESLKAWLPWIVSMYAHVPWLFTTLIPILGGS